MTTKLNSEANYETACQWWPDLRDICTPIGWKDHLFRFSVLWNGTVMADPQHQGRNTRAAQWKGQGVQITFAPEYSDRPWSHERHSYLKWDDGRVAQGWNDCAAPVLWSQSLVDGVLLRQEVFGHIPGGEAVKTGIEPLFMWVRLSVPEVCECMPIKKTARFLLKMNSPHIYLALSRRAHLFETEKSEYPRKLRAESEEYSSENGFFVLEEEEKVRLAVAPEQDCKVQFREHYPEKLDTSLYVTIPSEPGSSVDILLPMLPTDRDVFDKEFAMGYDVALKEANRNWAPKPKTAAIVDVPDTAINEVLKQSLKFQEIIAEKNPATGDYAILTGATRYSGMYATPNSMSCVMLEDALGYHEFIDRHIEVFRKNQGTVIAPGDSFELHPGYFSNPKELLNCVDWLSDHGAILYSVCMHALLTGDKAFIDRWTDNIIKACEFIQYARAITGHGGVEGVMPAGIFTDTGTKPQSIWNDAWTHKGLITAVRLLNKLKHPRAIEFAKEAEDYKTTFQNAFRARSSEMPTWKDKQGHTHSFVPMEISGEPAAELLNTPAYLDYGPLVLVFAGLFDADDPLMKSVLLWFREGPPTRYYRKHSCHALQPVLVHELSSFEPCYSWNLFHSHQQGDREKYIEGMYSLFAGGFSRQTCGSCECRDAISDLPCTSGLATYIARLAVIDDEIKEDELQLLRMVPKAWLRSDRETIFDNMPTVFGPVSLRFSLSKDGKTLKVSFKPEFREGEDPKRIVFHTPPVDGLEEIVVNGKTISADSNGKCIWNAKK